MIENLESHDILACKQYDPLLSHSKVVILSTQVSLVQEDENLLVTAIIRTPNHLFIQLSDSSYWDIMLIEKSWLNSEISQVYHWNRFDRIILKRSPYLEYPYILLSLTNQQELFCRQIDPAIPHSVHCSFTASKKNNEKANHE